MNIRKKFVLLAALCAGSVFAYEIGDIAYTKRADIALLAEPSPFAASEASLDLGARLTIAEVRGTWLQATNESGDSGWIFAGNVSAAAPDTESLLAQVPFDASATTSTAAARPLTPAADDYGARMNLGEAQDDLAWLMSEGALVSAAEVTAYLEENAKGEYQ